MGNILAEQNLYTHAADFSSGGADDPDPARASLVAAWKKNLGHNNSAADQNRAAGFSGFTYAPHDLGDIMGGATPNELRNGPQGNPIQAGGADDEYGPEAFSRLTNQVDGASTSKSLLGAFAQMLSLHGSGWNNVGMAITIGGSTTLRSALNRTEGIGGTPESSGGQFDTYDFNNDYRLSNWNSNETPPPAGDPGDGEISGSSDPGTEDAETILASTESSSEAGWGPGGDPT